MAESAEKQLAEMLKELQSRSKAKVIVESSFYALILVFLFVGNFITVLVMVLNRRMRTISNMFVASLAISDCCLGAFSACPVGLPTLALSHWPFSDATCQYGGYIAVSLSVASIHTLALMSANRYFRIANPIRYRRYFTKQKTMAMILVSWFYSMCAPLPYMLSGHKMVFHPSKFFCYLQIDSGPFTAFLVTVCIGPSITVIFYCYLRIFKIIQSHNKNFQTTGNGSSTVNEEEIKITLTLFVIVVLFVLCWTPVLLIDVIDTIRGSWTFAREAYVAYTFLATLSSALNPFVYGLMNRNFRKEYLKMLCCHCCRSYLIARPQTVQARVNAIAIMENHIPLNRYVK